MMRNFLKVVFSGEFAFTMFLIGSVFKETLPNGFTDLTLFFLITSFLVFLKRIFVYPKIKKAAVIPIALYSLIVVLFLISLRYSDSTIYALDKTTRFIFITGWAFIGSMFLLNDRERLKRFYKSLIIITVVSGLFIIYFFITKSAGSSGFTSLSGDNYLTTGRLLGLGSVLMLTLYLYGDYSRRVRNTLLLFTLLSTVALLITGARMPVLSLGVIIIFLVFKTIKISGSKIVFRKGTLKILGFATLVIISLILLKDAAIFHTTFNRLQILLSETGGGNSASERMRFYSGAIEMYKQNPIFGVGIGGFGINYTALDIRFYPHNIFLEFLSETGLVGLSLFMLLLLISIKRGSVSFRDTDPLLIGVTSATMYLFLNALVSGDFNDNRVFFMFLGLSSILPALRIRLLKSPANEGVEDKVA